MAPKKVVEPVKPEPVIETKKKGGLLFDDDEGDDFKPTKKVEATQPARKVDPTPTPQPKKKGGLFDEED